VTGCTFVSNSAATDRTVYGGGGIYNDRGTVTLTDSTLSANIAPFGGGVYNDNGTLTVTNSTLSDNSASQGGGGIYTLYHVPRLLNTLVAGNQSGRDDRLGPDIYGAVDSTSSNNLVGIGDRLLSGISNGPGGNLVGSFAASIDPRLGPLIDNGGPTLTHTLLDDSPARGAGSLDFASDTDQRGLPRTVGGEIDIGSFQTQSVVGPQVVVSDPSGPVDPPVNQVRTTFNHAMDSTTLTAAQFSLTGPGGGIVVTGVAVVPSTNNQQFDVSFASQSDSGDYTLVVGTGVRDVYGNPPSSPYSDRFFLAGAPGSTLTVNSMADTAYDNDPYLSLREAISIVNSQTLPTDLSAQILAQINGTLHANGSDTIAFDPTRVTGPITLGGTQLELSLLGSTARVTIDGGAGVTVDGNGASRVLQVDAGAQLTLEHLTISHGQLLGTGNGGGILNIGTLTLTSSTVSANFASTSGGGISNAPGGSLTVSNSTLSANSAGETGGGIDNSSGTVTVSWSTLSDNSAPNSGGGIDNVGGTVTVSDSTLSANSAGHGGGIYNSGTLSVSSSTLSGNAAYQGGGIANNTSSVTLSLQNSVLAGNSASHGGPDIFGGVQSSSSYNLVGMADIYLSGISDGSQGNQIGTTASPLDPRLAPLDWYGGPTQTFALLAGSPALDAGDPAQAGSPDQRGVGRSVRVNIGAFQASAASLLITAPDSVTAGVPFDFTVAAVDPYGNVDVSYVGSFRLGINPEFPDLADGVFTPADHGLVRFVGIGLYQAGVDTIVAAGELYGQASLTVKPDVAAFLVLSGPSSATAGTPFDVTVTAYDAFGNQATGYSGTVTFTTSDPDPGVVLPPDYTFQASDGGTVTFAGGVTLFTPGQQILTVTDLATGVTGSAVITL
jgi:hypothetical protein